MIDKRKVYVLFHANCFDGTGAKYAAWKHFKNKAIYIPVNYNEPVPDMEPGSAVYILDFSYPRKVMEQLVKDHALVVVLDHHKTAEEELKNFPNAIFDMNQSGAVLAWRYFHPGVSVPQLLLVVQDRDLWKFDYNDTKPVMAAVPLLKSRMEEWDEVCGSYKKYLNLKNSGKALEMLMKMKVDSYIQRKVAQRKYQNYNIGITNSTEYASEIGTKICLELPVDFAVIYCIAPDNNVNFSLRSTGDFDVSKIAAEKGGGGHKNAAGFTGTLADLQQMLQ